MNSSTASDGSWNLGERKSCNGSHGTGTGEVMSDVEAGGSTTSKKCMNPGEITGRLTSNLKSPRQTGFGDRRVPETSKFVGATAGRLHLEIYRLVNGALRTGQRGGRRSTGGLTRTPPVEHETWGVTGPTRRRTEDNSGQTDDLALEHNGERVSELFGTDGRRTGRAEGNGLRVPWRQCKSK
ncbi:hypothetical protein DVH05_000132 [Phytophthora capsici]|nr:hypothetical protein DVH05_000132 [Phytophthora capsici]